MYFTDEQIKEKFDEILRFRYSTGLCYDNETNLRLKKDYYRMFNIVSCKIDSFLQDMDKIINHTLDNDLEL